MVCCFSTTDISAMIALITMIINCKVRIVAKYIHEIIFYNDNHFPFKRVGEYVDGTELTTNVTSV